MKHKTYLLPIVFGLFNCNNQAAEKTVDKNVIDSVQITSINKDQTDIFVKDKSKYDQTFIDGLSGYNEPIKLIDNYIITGKDTTYFPDDLPLNKQTIFKGSRNSRNIVLAVTRTNLTDLTYNFHLTDLDNKTIDNKAGEAILGSMFFLGSENDADSQTGETYGSYEYWDKSNGCWFSIRIGIGEDDNGRQRATLTYGCEDKIKQTLNLDECPILRTE